MSVFTKYFEFKAKLNALEKSQATIEFGMDGTIITANDKFLSALGYTLSEIVGKNHSIFIDKNEKNSPAYRQFWESLNRGQYQAAEYKRIRKDGKEIWIQATYNPILDSSGKPIKVVKFATDITAQKLKSIDDNGLMEAIRRSQAIIQFNMDGTITEANENFLHVLGYTLSEIKGKHHSMFVESEFRNSVDYQRFWDALKRGEYQSAEYKRIGKGGREVWIQATYNPILDPTGKPVKVVKIATDITAQTKERLRRAAIQKEVDTSLGEITGATSTAGRQAESAASAAAQISTNVQAAATGTEQLVASISEISRRMSESARVTEQAMQQGSHTNTIMTNLAETVSRIGSVVSLIQQIANQTNLLALNATIEAARAGEAGKGFAVVASEVKNLATQTAKATDEISGQISSVQTGTDEVVKAIGGISGVITRINEISTAIASAVEEQDAVTREMATNMNAAAVGVNSISSNMNEIASAIGVANDFTVKVKEMSQSLVTQAS